MNTNKVCEVKEFEPVTTRGFVKLYAHGKVALLFDGPKAYQCVAEECFKRALKVRITVDDIAFERAMRDRGAPGAPIHEFLNTCSVFDEVHLGGLSLH